MTKTDAIHFEINSIAEAAAPVLRQYSLPLPYNMHYWYFYIIDPIEGNNFTYILSSIRTPAVLNGVEMGLEKSQYVAVISDFKNQKVTTQQKHIKLEQNKLTAEDFSLEFGPDKVKLAFDGKSFEFNQIRGGSHVTQLPTRIYDFSTTNFTDGRYYMNAESVAKRGPLGPWNWLHLHLEDGNEISVYNLLLLPLAPMRVNGSIFRIVKKLETSERLEYLAKQGDLFFSVKLRKPKFKSTMVYRPRFSPAWTYNQLAPEIEEIATNIPGINPNQRSSAILENARGWSL